MPALLSVKDSRHRESQSITNQREPIRAVHQAHNHTSRQWSQQVSAGRLPARCGYWSLPEPCMYWWLPQSHGVALHGYLHL